MTDWKLEDAPDQTGRSVIITGANCGLGFEVARMLALLGARVVLACRNQDKAQAAREQIIRAHPGANLAVESLDLSDLASVRKFAERFKASAERLDILINNAGVMNPPFTRTAQGFELQFGTNHLGHFALSAQLWPLLARSAGSRVVTVSSQTAHLGKIDFEDPNFERRRYQGWVGYAQSKLANSMFALELARRAAQADASVVVTASHPGWTATELSRGSRLIGQASRRLAMPAAGGALTTLRAAVDPRAANGSYWGPARWFELVGTPEPARIPRRARDPEAAKRLWELSERLTGTTFVPLHRT
jgi:NAD(P)-dependent dehydrogenase (short-subunit alcohol dehydrogenase family)